MRHMTPEECSEIETLLSEESTGSKEGASSTSMARSSTKVRDSGVYILNDYIARQLSLSVIKEPVTYLSSGQLPIIRGVTLL